MAKWTRNSSADKIVIKIMSFISSFQTRQLTDNFSTSFKVSYWGDADEWGEMGVIPYYGACTLSFSHEPLLSYLQTK